MSALTVTALNRYPIKSCRGEAVSTAIVERQGFAGDRRFMIVDAVAKFLTAREHPRLLLVRPELTECGLRLSGPGQPDVEVGRPNGRPVEVRVWRNVVSATPADDAAHDWLSSYLGVAVRLVYQHDPASRPTNPDWSEAEDRVSFADGYPVLATTDASLAALNDWIAEGPMADQGPIPMTRFRPSIVIGGGAPWDEDGWRRLRIGAAEFRAVKGCDRCVITTTDADTAARGKEPIATLARHRRWDGETWFGMNLVPDNPGARISVCDEVRLLESVSAPDGPPR